MGTSYAPSSDDPMPWSSSSKTEFFLARSFSNSFAFTSSSSRIIDDIVGSF